MRASGLLSSLALCLAFAACRGQSAIARQQAPDTTLALLSADSQAESAIRFTQSFYDWYRSVDDAVPTAIDRGPEFFAPQLLSALRADMDEAQRRRPWESTTMDWDPFTASQDPCDPYRAGRARRHGDTIIVAVTHLGCGASPERGRPDVLAKLRQFNGRWQFVDFLDVSDSVASSVLQVLAYFAAERASQAAHRKR